MEASEMEFMTGASEYAQRTGRIGSDCREHAEEYTMPDYIPDIKRVVSVSAVADMRETGGENGRYGWECELTYTALLLGEDDTVRNVVLQSRVEGEVKCDSEADGVWLEARLENAGMRATDPRRLSARSRVCVTAWAQNRICTGITVEGGGEHSDSCIEKKKSLCSYTVLSREKQEDLRVSEDIELDSSAPEITDIICCEVNPYIQNVAVTGGEMTLRGEAQVSLLYSDVNGEYHSHMTHIPLSCAFECSCGELRGAFAEARTDEIKAAAQTNAFGEQKVIELDFSWDAEVWCAEEGECETVCDLYSTADEVSLTHTQARLERLAGAFTGNLSITQEATLEDAALSRAQSIVCIRPTAEIDEVRRGEDGRLLLLGTVKSSVICRTDSEGERLCTAEIKTPFKYERDIAVGEDDFECRAGVQPLGIKARIENGRLTADCELGISGIVQTPFTEEIISGARVTGQIESDRAAMTLCYTAGGEPLWDIAKRYRVPAEEILERNGICDEELADKKVLVIPGARPVPGFSRVI